MTGETFAETICQNNSQFVCILIKSSLHFSSCMTYTLFVETPRYLEIPLRNRLSMFFLKLYKRVKWEFCPATIVKLVCLPIRKRLAALAADCSR